MESALSNLRIDFAVIGAQKCGTTALWQYLRSHPRVARSIRKELHYFDRRPPDQGHQDWLTNEDFWPGEDRSKLHGDFTPSYLFHPLAITRLIRHNPEVKCIVLLRNPVERAFSHWRMQIARKIETLSFSDAIRNGRLRIVGIDPDNSIYRQFSYIERGFYGLQIDRLLKQVSRDNCLFLSFRHLRECPQTVVNEIYDFLGIDHFNLIEKNLFNFSFSDQLVPTLSKEDAEYLDNYYYTDKYIAEKIVGFSI